MLRVLLIASLLGLSAPARAPATDDTTYVTAPTITPEDQAKLVWTEVKPGEFRPLITLATTENAIHAPVADPEVLAKFPREDPSEVAILEYTNAIVNGNITYVDDQTHYGMDDMWVMDPADMKGDCEDYAMTKYSVLFRAGCPTLTNTRILAADVLDKGQWFGHAILEVRMTHGTIAILDSRFDHLMTKKELVKNEHYKLFDWS